MSDYLTSLAARGPDAVIGWRAGEAVRQAAFMRRVAAWRALGLRTPGRQVALYLDDSIEFAAALLGAWQGGKTVWLAADTLVATCAALARTVDAFFGEFPHQHAPQLPQDDEHCALPWDALEPGSDALVVHTSGSTGAAQAIPKQLVQLTSEVATLEALFGARIGDAEVFATVSHQHIYGLLFKVLWPLASGRAIHARSLGFPEELAQLLGQRPCVLVASPAHLKRLPDQLDWSAAARCLRAVYSSGGPLAPEVAVAVSRILGQIPTEIYGSSETGGIAWRQRQPGASGAWEALPNVEWRVDPEGGLLEVRSPHLGTQDWLQLADRVQPSGAGHFLLQGRADRIVKIEEKRISLDAIEAALLASGLAREARVVVGAEVPGQRQILAAFVVASDTGRALLAGAGKQALNAGLRAALAGVVEAVALPRRWRYLDQMPVNAQGKTTHAQLLALLGGGPDTRTRLPHISVLEQEPRRVLFALTVPSTLFYFDGHFSQAPVLPGVVQVDWAILYGRRHFALPPSFGAIHALKFQHIIEADTPIFLELVHDELKGSLNFRYFSDAGQHAGGRILFGP
jgi:acyl-coenzyme A synthetase/AMP-(fatty) acid ligase